MRIDTVLFDMDNTLYDELTYVESGFRAAAELLYLRLGVGAAECFALMRAAFDQHGRGRVFDYTLEQLGVRDARFVLDLVDCYRAHRPAIHFYSDVTPCLNELRRSGMKLGVITDGIASVQRVKVEALGLTKLVDVVVYTDDFGKEFWKPHTLPFRHALAKVGSLADRTVYVGDDETRDFKGGNELGMTTIRITRKPTSRPIKAVAAEFRAKYQIGTLAEITSLLRAIPPLPAGGVRR